MTDNFFTPENYQQAVGKTFYSGWLLVDQQMISDFGRITRDPDPHHIDPEWAAKHSPWGSKTISFGWLTVSLLSAMLYDIVRFPLDGGPKKDGYPVNYGFNRMRFVAPVVVDSRIRTRYTLLNATEIKPGCGYLC